MAATTFVLRLPGSATVQVRVRVRVRVGLGRSGRRVGRCRGDAGEMYGRCAGDVREMWAHLERPVGPERGLVRGVDEHDLGGVRGRGRGSR